MLNAQGVCCTHRLSTELLYITPLLAHADSRSKEADLCDTASLDSCSVALGSAATACPLARWSCLHKHTRLVSSSTLMLKAHINRNSKQVRLAAAAVLSDSATPVLHDGKCTQSGVRSLKHCAALDCLYCAAPCQVKQTMHIQLTFPVLAGTSSSASEAGRGTSAAALTMPSLPFRGPVLASCWLASA